MARQGDERWKDHAGRGTSVEEEAARLFRDAPRAAPLAPEKLDAAWASIAAKIALSAAAGGAAALGAKLGLQSVAKWKVMAVLGAVGLGTAAVSARVLLRPQQVAVAAPRVREPPVPAVASDTAMPSTPSGGFEGADPGERQGERSAATDESPAPKRVQREGSKHASTRTEMGTDAPAAAIRSTNAAEKVTEPARQAATRGGSLADESTLVGLAVKQLRVEHDPAAAVSTLRRYELQFPHGTLAREATVMRIDALLALGRRGEALMILEQADIASLPRSTELRVVRAEVLAETSRCATALNDFDFVLSAPRAKPLEERALFGRAACRTSLGDALGARVDYEQYLAQFPQGRFAPSARSALKAPK